MKLTNVEILDLINGGSFTSTIHIKGDRIVAVGDCIEDVGGEVIDCTGLTAVPGFIDSHVHIESSMVHPLEFERITMKNGTTAVVCDPHEIANVMGIEGVRWFQRCSKLAHQHQFVQISSCVPALKGFEDNFGELTTEQMIELMQDETCIGMGEMMNAPGVIGGDPDVLAKINAFRAAGKTVDGHSPMLRGAGLNAYLNAGVENDHETISAEEAQEKLSRGMGLCIRQGTVAKNLEELSKVVTEFNSIQCMLCTDDRNPLEIERVQHINSMIRYLLQVRKLPAHVAYRMASYSTARHFGLKNMGLIAPGKIADIVLLSDVQNVEIARVFVSGVDIKDLKLDETVNEKFAKSNPPLQNTVKINHLEAKDFALELTDGKYNVMGLIKDQLITEHKVVECQDGKFAEDDILKMSVIERYGKHMKPSIGFVKGFGLKGGALASTVAHDCHNCVVIGDNDRDMAIAVNALIEHGGGQCVVVNGKVDSILPLEIGGLMSKRESHYVVETQMKLEESYSKLGVKLEAPFLSMGFLALPVIPTIKLTDRGLFDLESFKYIDLKA